MSRITNDHTLRQLLSDLDPARQQKLGARFTQSVAHLNGNERIARAIEAAVGDDTLDTEIEDAYKAAKNHATMTYTDCGKDTDWPAQAEHFVAAALAAALIPEPHRSKSNNHAWKAAVQARMAQNCELMDSEEGEEETEAERQYRIAEQFLGE